MTEIAAKFASSMQGFWWSLDEQERRLLLLGILYLGAVMVAAPVARQRREQERHELADELAARLSERGSRG